MGQPLTDAQVKATLKANKAFPASMRQAAKSIGIGYSTFNNRLKELEKRGHKIERAAPAGAAVDLAKATTADVKGSRRAADTMAAQQRMITKLTREANDAEDLRKFLFGVTSANLERPEFKITTRPASKSPGTPILFTSDFQWGEVIEARELDGINAFNLDIARQRYHRLIERTIDLCKHHMTNPTYDGIIYLRGGDMVSGDIHDELRETNDANAGEATRDLVRHEVEGIRALAGVFGKVHVISVPGNHGRTTEHPRAKKAAVENWDTVSAWWLEDIFREAKDSRVTFHTPPSGDAIFSVYGRKFLMSHGDKIGSSGGQGFIGPSATIARGMKKTMDYYASMNILIYKMLVGHFHTALELERGFANGCLPGMSEYGKGLRPLVLPPTQWLLFNHPKYGVTARWQIYLGEQRDFASTIPDLGGKR